MQPCNILFAAVSYNYSILWYGSSRINHLFKNSCEEWSMFLTRIVLDNLEFASLWDELQLMRRMAMILFVMCVLFRDIYFLLCAGINRISSFANMILKWFLKDFHFRGSMLMRHSRYGDKTIFFKEICMDCFAIRKRNLCKNNK